MWPHHFRPAGKKEFFQVAESLLQVSLMEPPWKLSTSQLSRGMAVSTTSSIEQIPVKAAEEWSAAILAINTKYKYAFTVKLMEQPDYRIADEQTNLSTTSSLRGRGYYLQDAKEACLIGAKGDPLMLRHDLVKDFIFSNRRRRAQKPDLRYEYSKEQMPNGQYLEIFGHWNRLRDKWVAKGNQV